MNKNSSMSSFFNYFKDFISNKILVETDPLDQISNKNKTNTLPINDYSGNINLQEKYQKSKNLFN
jgi:hypothetical protein